MNGMFRVALMVGMVGGSAVAVEAAQPYGPDEITTEIYVVNNHLVAVRVYAEDAEGKLHALGRVARGGLATFQVPEEFEADEFRIKVFPNSTAWSPIPDDYGVKTNPLDATRDRQVRMWLESDLTQSIVEIERD